MADNASVMFRTQYIDRVQPIYQNRGNKLRGTVTPATSFNGSSEAKFFLAGKSVAFETTGPRQLNTPSGQGITPFTVPLRTFTVYDEVYEWDEDRLTVDEKEVIYTSGAMAMGRKEDAIIFAEMAAAVPTFTTGCDFSGGVFGAAAAITMCEALQGQIKEWVEGEIFCPLPQKAWNNLMLNKVFASSDWNPPDSLPFMKRTQSRDWNGVIWFLLVEEEAGELYPIPEANKQDIFMYHKPAIGWASHTDWKVTTQWHNEIDTLSINLKRKGAVTTLQEGNGIVRARVSSNVANAVSE